MEATFIEDEVEGRIATITRNRAEAANPQTVPQPVFDIHEAGHGNALSVSGLPILMLDDMKTEIAEPAVLSNGS